MPNFLTELLEKDSVLSPVLCYSKKKTFEIIAMAASKKVGLDAVHLLKLLNERESLGSTYIANGFVFPHAVIPDEYTETAVLLLLDHHVQGQLVTVVHPLTRHKAVELGHLRHRAHVGSYQHVGKAEVL